MHFQTPEKMCNVLSQSCLGAVAHYWHREILANLWWTPPLFSGPYLSLWSWYWDTISGIWKGIDTPIKWYNGLIYKPINPRAIAPQRQYSELFVQRLYDTNNYFCALLMVVCSVYSSETVNCDDFSVMGMKFFNYQMNLTSMTNINFYTTLTYLAIRTTRK